MSEKEPLHKEVVRDLETKDLSNPLDLQDLQEEGFKREIFGVSEVINGRAKLKVKNKQDGQPESVTIWRTKDMDGNPLQKPETIFFTDISEEVIDLLAQLSLIKNIDIEYEY